MMKKTLLFIFLFIATISFSQKKSIDKLVASPNPFVNNTVVSFETNNTYPIIFSIRNVLGKTVYKQKITAKKGQNLFTFNRNNLKSGMYIYTIQTGKKRLSKRFVIE